MSLVFGAQKNCKKGRSLDKGSNRDEACLLSSSCRTGKLQEQNDMLSSCYKMTQMISPAEPTHDLGLSPADRDF